MSRDAARYRPGLRSAPGPGAGRPRACDDEALVCHGTIYGIPVWEISRRTGLIRLYRADPATGNHVLDDAGNLIPAGEVPAADMARRDAQPRIVIDYVGQTIRPLQVREDEHAEDKSWADVIAGPAMVLAEGQWDKAERDRREVAAITALKPRFNKEHNEGNPHRIEIWRQTEMRHIRDDALRRPRWIPLQQRTALALQAAQLDVVGAGLDGREPRYPLTVLGRALAGAGRWLWAWPAVRTAALLLVLWATLLVGAAYALLQWGLLAQSRLPAAVIVATALTAGLGGGRRRRRRRRRRR
jgi:hypothetical protein